MPCFLLLQSAENIITGQRGDKSGEDSYSDIININTIGGDLLSLFKKQATKLLGNMNYTTAFFFSNRLKRCCNSSRAWEDLRTIARYVSEGQVCCKDHGYFNTLFFFRLNLSVPKSSDGLLWSDTTIERVPQYFTDCEYVFHIVVCFCDIAWINMTVE